ncbi:ABC transporter ATP-binding protein YtrE [Clostridium ljungdahlii]|uniref:ABC transporter ATP-binding protein YtrE n=1 Tax=Clostridium ljungdahlii TaxID=1538 RepID=A0A166R037_9CLOT|nr:ABC transporter ATP-binding protein YtrE [Clostridium ljungdahlii]
MIQNLTVLENVEVVSNISKTPLKTDEILKAVGMFDKRYRFPKELSGGEQQRVSIARAVVKNPKLLLCDEPTGALDFLTSREILKLLQKVNEDFKTTILMITHNTAISHMAHRIYKIKNWRSYYFLQKYFVEFYKFFIISYTIIMVIGNIKKGVIFYAR